MENNLKIVNLVVSGNIPIKKRFTNRDISKLINLGGWFSPREDMIMLSKQYEYRTKVENNVHHKQKNPYVTIWMSGAIVIVGLKSRKEANQVYNLVIKDLKRIKKELNSEGKFFSSQP